MLAQGDEPTRTALKRAIAPAVKTLRTEAQAEKKERRAVREIELGAKQAALPAKKYGVIYADPEWRFDPYSTETGMDRSPDNHYPTSSLLTLMQRDIGALAAKDCVLFLWATAPMLVEAICLLDAWGFAWIERDPNTGFLAPNKVHARYVSHWTWLKNRIATGYWNRGKHEILLIATRGNPVAPAMGDQLDSWCEDMAVEADVGRHSAKPAVFAEWIEKHWPNTPKIELNARAPRPGWDVWGNESQAKASEDNGGTSATDGAPMAGEANRPDAGRSASATSERMDVTAGETAPNSKRGFLQALSEWTELRKLETRSDLTPEEIARRDFIKPIVEADLAPVVRPSISDDEKSEFDLLSAIARGEKGEGPLFERLKEQGLIWAGRELSVGGAKRLAELGRLIDVAGEVPA
ncbi:MAG: hypothetical protein E5X79_01450 [Mesorhizobium sp.]|nr:MAG: hypothetical protein E5X79_01450 [Mesorhizobium sp.]